MSYRFIHKNSSYSLLVTISFFFHITFYIFPHGLCYLSLLPGNQCQSFQTLFNREEIFKHKIILIFFLRTVILQDPFRSAAQQESLIYNGIIISSVFFFPLTIMDHCITFASSAQLHRLMFPSNLHYRPVHQLG